MSNRAILLPRLPREQLLDIARTQVRSKSKRVKLEAGLEDKVIVIL